MKESESPAPFSIPEKRPRLTIIGDFQEIAELAAVPQELILPLNDFLYIREDGELTIPITRLDPEWSRWKTNFKNGQPVPWSDEMQTVMENLRPHADRVHAIATHWNITKLKLIHTPSAGNFQSPNLPSA